MVNSKIPCLVCGCVFDLCSGMKKWNINNFEKKFHDLLVYLDVGKFVGVYGKRKKMTLQIYPVCK